MPEILGINKLLSTIPKKRFGRFNQYGTSLYAFSRYGDEDIFLIFTEYGNSRFGIEPYGNILLLSGIYRTDNVTGKIRFYREPYYIPYNPRTPDQQANREKIINAIIDWRGLTDERKTFYNKKAIRKRMSGYNLSLREYLLSH